jgi:hypothetical protein
MWWRRLRYVLLLVALCSIATCPAAKRSCTARSRAQEADDLVSYLGDRVAAAIAATGHVPPVAAGPTPAASCCDQGGACAADPAQWSAPGWKALAFSIDGEHRYAYSYVPDPGGRAAVVRATGDLDCDGTAGSYELEIRIEADGVRRRWTRKNPFE